MGVSKDQNTQHGALEQGSGFATNLGEGDLTASSAFMRDILSGDATKQAQALAPEISAAKTSAAQSNKTNAEFGNRAGGTNASTAATNDKVHSDITNLLGSLTGSSASGLASTGSNLLNLGIQGNQVGFNQASQLQQQKLAKFNDIISSSASVAEGVLGAIPGKPGGFADVGSNVAGGFD